MGGYKFFSFAGLPEKISAGLILNTKQAIEDLAFLPWYVV